MSVLIKGKALPKCCGDCWLARCVAYSDYCRVLSVDINVIDPTYKHPNCPLVEVPVPHGDLIDRDALNIGEYEREDDDTGTLEISLGGLLDLYHKVKDAQIVIEAEWSEDDDD